MKVSELISKLEAADPNATVVLSKDEEGNGFGPLQEVEIENSTCVDQGYEIQIGLHHLTPELEKAGYTDEDVLKGDGAVVLWP